MPARPNIHAPLQVFVDAPTDQDVKFGGYGTSRVSRLMFWMLEKWTLSPEEVGINFALRCANDISKKVDKRDALTACAEYSDRYIEAAVALIGFGELSSIRLLGDRPLASTVYQRHRKVRTINYITRDVFVAISYSPGYFLQKPSETTDGMRMLYWAAEAAGLKPMYNKDLPDFDFGII